MANTMTALLPTIFAAAQIVSRELTGFVAAVDRRFSDNPAAQGDTIKVPYTPALSTSDYTAAMTTTAGTDQTPSVVSMTLNQHKEVSWNLTSEELRSLQNGGDNAMEFMRQSTEQAIRALVNGIESRVATVAYQGASRATGTAGTTPFGSNLSAAADLRKILDDNGAPMGDRSLIIDTAAGVKLRSLTQLTNANQAGSASTLRDGLLLDLFGFGMRESAQVVSHTKGTGTSYQLSAAGSIGDTTINVDTGSGTLLAGDVVTFAGTSDKYVANTALSGGVFTIGRPGLLAAEADNDAITIGNSYTANVGLHRNSVILLCRPPTQVDNPSIRATPITDPGTGLTMLFEEIMGDGMATYRIRVLYQAMAVQSEHIAILLG